MKLFSRNKVPSDPEIVVNNCLDVLLNKITDDLIREEYSWNKPWGVKRFESIVLAKFILDDSFERFVKEQLSDDEKKGYYELSNTLFESIFNTEFAEIGMNFQDMQEEISGKLKAYSLAWQEDRQPPECYYKIYMLIAGSPPREELEEEANKKTAGLEIMRSNEYFAPLVVQYEARIKHLKEQVVAFDKIDIMLPHMMRTAKQIVKNINLKKIKSLSKKLEKKDKKK